MMQYTIEQEEIATEFALALLMPEDEYREQVRIHTEPNGMVNTKAIADYFHVEINVAHIRGVRLGILRNF